jgi:hypothetical protein
VRRLWHVVRWPFLVLGVLFVAIQFVPYGWKHSNPQVTQDAPWPDAESEHLARVACYDCHSNETNWRAYTYVAPISWLSIHDVEEGRDKLNFSEWDRDQREADKAGREVRNGSMPPDQYTIIHRDADLSDADKDKLIAALDAMNGGKD